MTPEVTAEALEAPPIIAPSTAGMTTRVVKGSLWTLVGQVLPMAVSFVATPFTIRLLGSEAYGVVILIGLIPTYFGFADFGMGIASTKFGSEAYGEGKPEKEGEIVRTATLIALVTSLIFAIPMFLFSGTIIAQFAVPPDLQHTASLALKIASVSFVLTMLAMVINTPMLARLRMEMNALTGSLPKILTSVITPIVLYAGWGILGAAWTLFFGGILSFVLVFYFSSRLLPTLPGTTINRQYLRPLLRFGGGWIIGSIAAVLLVNFEKLALTKIVSVKALAYYTVAFALAGMATMFSGAMSQTLVPAFSQLLGPGKKEQFDALFTRGMRLNLLFLLPGITVLFVIAKPFFTLWAGEEFGRESTLPFYILLFGLFFNILAYIPLGAIMAKGRTDVIAKIYWFQLVFYVVAVYFLIGRFGIAGAAAAWSARVILDAGAMFWFSKRIAHVSAALLKHFVSLIAATLLLLPSAFFAIFYNNFSILLLIIVPLGVGLYGLIAWKKFVLPTEKAWALSKAIRFKGLVRGAVSV